MQHGQHAFSLAALLWLDCHLKNLPHQCCSRDFIAKHVFHFTLATGCLPGECLFRVGPDDKPRFGGGYFDASAFSEDGRYSSSLLLPFEERLPKGENATFQVLDVYQNFSVVREFKTAAWNFQQGCKATFFRHPRRSEPCVVFNDACVEQQGVCGRVHCLMSTKLTLKSPFYDVSPTGAYYGSLNYGRLWRFRKAYGYSMALDTESKSYKPSHGLEIRSIETDE